MSPAGLGMSKTRLLAYGLFLALLAGLLLSSGHAVLFVWADWLRAILVASHGLLGPYLGLPDLSTSGLSVLFASSAAVLPRAALIAWRTMRLWRRRKISKARRFPFRASLAA